MEDALLINYYAAVGANALKGIVTKTKIVALSGKITTYKKLLIGKGLTTVNLLHLILIPKTGKLPVTYNMTL